MNKKHLKKNFQSASFRIVLKLIIVFIIFIFLPWLFYIRRRSVANIIYPATKKKLSYPAHFYPYTVMVKKEKLSIETVYSFIPRVYRGGWDSDSNFDSYPNLEFYYTASEKIFSGPYSCPIDVTYKVMRVESANRILRYLSLPAVKNPGINLAIETCKRKDAHTFIWRNYSLGKLVMERKIGEDVKMEGDFLRGYHKIVIYIVGTVKVISKPKRAGSQ